MCITSFYDVLKVDSYPLGWALRSWLVGCWQVTMDGRL